MSTYENGNGRQGQGITLSHPLPQGDMRLISVVLGAKNGSYSF
ncbi:Uncharacterised protein [Salmonella enterica subsp. arizonae]|uniref:Uncharacterized protein n=1 Tax=Salmonella enterica subsp. arizonae TaxID=59203 RepID=A0A2X4U022_SALER|nr:Uncharacterised protein [Salmonella enterica subsp. arizonae]